MLEGIKPFVDTAAVADLTAAPNPPAIMTVTESAVVQRIRRALRKTDYRLSKGSSGSYYIISGRIPRQDHKVYPIHNLEASAREWKALRPHERMK